MSENEANIELEKLGSSILSIEGINYAAVVNEDDDENDYYIQIGYEKEKFKPNTLYRLPDNRSNHRPIEISFENEKSIKIRNYGEKKTSTNFPIALKEMRSNFSYDTSIDNNRGVIRQGLGGNLGTIGGILKLADDNINSYIISNWHILMDDYGEKGSNIIDKKGNIVATLHWAVNNEYYDIAIAKITNNDLLDKSINCFDLASKPLKHFTIGNEVSKCGYKSGTDDKGIIISKNAYVKIGKSNRIYKNQILSSKISIPGDSGSLLVDNSTNERNVIGLVFASDQYDFTVSNHLYYLFANEIKRYQYNDTIIMPNINFKTFVNP